MVDRTIEFSSICSDLHHPWEGPSVPSQLSLPLSSQANSAPYSRGQLAPQRAAWQMRQRRAGQCVHSPGPNEVDLQKEVRPKDLLAMRRKAVAMRRRVQRNACGNESPLATLEKDLLVVRREAEEDAEGVRPARPVIIDMPIASARVDQSDVFAITYSVDWGVVLEEHMLELMKFGRMIGDYTVKDKYGFCVDIATTSEVPDPSRFPLRFVWKGLPKEFADQQSQQLEVADPQEFVLETKLTDLAMQELPDKFQTWQLENPTSVAAQDVGNIQATSQATAFEDSWLVLDA